MGLIDSHAHLTYEGLHERVDEVLANCAAAGVDRVITIGTDLDDARDAIKLARANPKRVHASVGFHPHEADKVSDADIEAMAKLWDEDVVVAAGEMGLDYHYDFADRKKQHHVFASQLQHGAKRDLPIVIHSREAMEDTVAILVEHGFANRRVVFHCFTGSADEAARVAEHGWRISFTGIVTFKNSKDLQAIARDYPAESLMVETDSPYLSPVPVRSVRPNEPAHVAHVASFLAQLRSEDEAGLIARTAANTMAFFGLPS